jgi:hypothetical protein
MGGFARQAGFVRCPGGANRRPEVSDEQLVSNRSCTSAWIVILILGVVVIMVVNKGHDRMSTRRRSETNEATEREHA